MDVLTASAHPVDLFDFPYFFIAILTINSTYSKRTRALPGLLSLYVLVYLLPSLKLVLMNNWSISSTVRLSSIKCAYK